MKVSKNAAVFMLLIALLSALFFACAKKGRLTALVSGPTITAVTSSASADSATITWTTSTLATSKVYYGTSTSFSSSTTEADTGSNMTRNHSVNITGLTASTKYYYYVASKDAANNTSTLGDDGSYSFTTTSAGPTISNVAATSSTSTSASVTWTTNEGATSQVFYGLTTSFGSNTTETTTTTTTSHSVSLTGLTASTTYYYYVRSKNAAGNASTSGADGSKTFYTSATSSGTTFYIYFDDIKIEGTGGSPVIIYDDNIGSSVITGGTSNAAYMGSPNNGVDNITAIDFLATDDKNSGSASWKISLTKTTGWWAGIYLLGTGEWRANWTGATPSPPNLTGPTGTVKLTCYAKVVGKTATKIKIGIGDNSGATVDDSLTGGKKESAKLDLTNTWTKLELDLTGQDLSSINGVFFWSIDGADVP